MDTLKDNRLQRDFYVLKSSSHAAGCAILPLLVVIGYAIVQMVRSEFTVSDYVALFANCAIVIVFKLTRAAFVSFRAGGLRRRFWMTILDWLDLIVCTSSYLYIILFWGLGALFALADGFSFKPIMRAVFFIGLGLVSYRQHRNLGKIDFLVERSVSKEGTLILPEPSR